MNIGRSKFAEIISLCEAMSKKWQKEQEKLPYHINIIDLLGANENAHSRILNHLLQQHSHKRFEILESLLNYIAEIHQNFKLTICFPSVTTQKDNIDILIKDKTYAIIFENKIHNAVDQETQLSRYIEQVGRMGYKKEQIYILYLPRDDGKTPNDNSWGKYKEMFKDRYMNLTYRDHILPWLRDRLLPEIRIKDIYLKSCIEQYVDHLEGLFSLRKIQENMNQELKKEIFELLGLNASSANNHSIISEKINEINQVRDQLTMIRAEIEKEYWIEWTKRIQTDFPDLELMHAINDRNFPKLGVKLCWNNINFCVLIEQAVHSNDIYYGIGRHYASEHIHQELKKFLSPLIDGFKSSPWWYGWKNTSFKDGYNSLHDYIEEVVQYIHPKD